MCSVCWIPRREYSRQTRRWCVGISVSIIVRVSQLLGSDQGKGSFKCYVTLEGVGGYMPKRYEALRGGGGGLRQRYVTSFF